ncbi:DUF4844 domain-containing protein [Pseudomonas sp. CGJS7]|uniref:DUF4844 domain-containing protein n=1 Tax=Pseudomonas sp. CGJS7 TaxID=3109348 RepID=UPI00300B8C1A
MHSETDAATALLQLKGRDHFAGQPGTLYTGVQDRRERAALNARFDRALAALAAAVAPDAPVSTYLTIIDAQINEFVREDLDTEDAEQVASCFEQAMDCLGIESSGGILNRWLYGFDVG